jgi:A/G-specific adenine glycosylase
MQRAVINWYKKNKRDLPWRKTTPWGVLLSEYMLQQTPVSRALPIWNEWIKRWPTPRHLSKAKRSDVIKAWGSLGYPTRALRLHQAATNIATDYKNKVPDTLENLRKLPGIGEYTAAAIYSFAFNKRALVLDINIRRLFIRAIDGKEHPPLHITNSEREAREKLIPKDAALFAAATMELGALICTSKNPKCDQCPIKNKCEWRKQNYPRSPIKKKTQTWHGTNRQCRGTILKHLRTNQFATHSELSKLWKKKSQFEESLTALINEGFIEKEKRKYKLAN